MNEANWNECINNAKAKRITPDIFRANSLELTAKQRIKLIKEITYENCNFVFEDYYTSLIELIQAKAFRQGFNILNHICIGFYLRDHIKQPNLYLNFNDLRYKRNSLTYYGSMMEFQIAKQAITQCEEIIKEIK